MYSCESWTVKRAECQRIDALKLWCWRRLLRVYWTETRSNQSILKKINPEYSLEELMLKLQYFGHLMQTAHSLEKTLVLGKIESRRRGCQRMRWLDGWMASPMMQWTWTWANSRRRWETGGLVCSSPWSQRESDMTRQLNSNKLRMKTLKGVSHIAVLFHIRKREVTLHKCCKKKKKRSYTVYNLDENLYRLAWKLIFI